MALNKEYKVTQGQLEKIAEGVLPKHLGSEFAKGIAKDCDERGVLCQPKGMEGPSI